MLKKRHKLRKQWYIKFAYLQRFSTELIYKSLRSNYYIAPIDRISYFAQSGEYESWHMYFNTYQRLLCPISLSHKVPSRAFHYSRFFLNKQLNYLMISNTLK